MLKKGNEQILSEHAIAVKPHSSHATPMTSPTFPPCTGRISVAVAQHMWQGCHYAGMDSLLCWIFTRH